MRESGNSFPKEFVFTLSINNLAQGLVPLVQYSSTSESHVVILKYPK